MPRYTYSGKPQPPTHIGGKFADRRMSRPPAHERGPSGPAAVGPIFRIELPRPAPEPSCTTETRDNPFRPSAYGARQSKYNVGRSACLTGRSGIEFFEEDGYPTPHLSQLNFPSHHTTPHHHNITYQTRESEYVGTCSLQQGDPTGVCSDVNRVLAQDGNSSVKSSLSRALCGGIYRYLSAQRPVLRTHVPSDT
jgi:hypothetical protein